ncbi:neutral zinc metallopeptidase [Marinactinospora thermotolerans]|uniref:neutral zinc metallopeptidase n=1 Tax=Marinactinospora thermotolerans TaxID=531310 RepID=UPI003D9490E7
MDTIRGGASSGSDPDPMPDDAPREARTAGPPPRLPIPPPHPFPPPYLPPHPGAIAPPPPRPAPPGHPPGPALWISAGGAAVASLISLVVCVVLVAGSLSSPDGAAGKPGPAHTLDLTLVQAPGPAEIDLTEHPFYALPAPDAARCSPPELDLDSAGSWEAFTSALGTCLDEVWTPRLTDLGLRPQPPAYVVLEELPQDWPEEDIEQDGVTLAYYEEWTNTITVLLPSIRQLAEYLAAPDDEGVWGALIAHEYGHYLQAELGLLGVVTEMELSAKSERAALAVTRRAELQADCLGGIALRAFDVYDDAQAEAINTDFNGGGDSETHGTTDNRQHWFEEGWDADSAGDCNTFDAEGRLVR